MKREMLLDAVSALDSEALDEALCERARLLPRAERRIKPLTLKRMGVAACFLAVLLVLPYAMLVFSGSNETAPHTQFFASAEDAEAALGEGLLLDRLEDSLTRTDDIRVTYTTEYYAAEGEILGSMNDGAVNKPRMLVATYRVIETTGGMASDPLPTLPVETSVEHEAIDSIFEGPVDAESPVEEWAPPETDDLPLPSDGEGDDAASVRLYILFDCDSVEDSYIGGYEEQGLTQWYGDIAVHYSVIRDPRMHGQAKFLYGGNLYVLDVASGDQRTLFHYLDLLLGEEGAS